MRKHRRGDYDRVDDYLGTISSDIEFEYGKPYNKLDRQDQREVLLDHFFKGLPQYEKSAEELRIGIAEARVGESNISVDTISFHGHDHRVIRDTKSGRFKQWVREE